VPTFIFKEEGKEFARIVESPSTDLLTDVAQIALGYPSTPNYAGANYMLQIFDSMAIDEVYKNINDIYRSGYYKVCRYSELNTLGHVLSASDRKKQALLVFQFNTYYYSGNPITFENYGELLVEMENYPQAVKQYEKLVALNPKNEEAMEELNRIKVLAEERKERDQKGANE
jgi:tetratricopeptide (TPR) repeat protein